MMTDFSYNISSVSPETAYVEELSTRCGTVDKAVAFEYDGTYIVAVKLQPLFTRSERQAALSSVKSNLAAYGFSALVTADLDIFGAVLRLREGRESAETIYREVINRI